MDYQPRDLAREAEMTTQYSGGMSLAEVGAIHGISRERVRQILDRIGVPRRSRGRPAPSSEPAKTEGA